jgi:hypothetical protein
MRTMKSKWENLIVIIMDGCPRYPVNIERKFPKSQCKLCMSLKSIHSEITIEDKTNKN